MRDRRRVALVDHKSVHESHLNFISLFSTRWNQLKLLRSKPFYEIPEIKGLGARKELV